MADEFVGAAQFGEFVKRIDEAFVNVNKLADQRYEKSEPASGRCRQGKGAEHGSHQ